MAAKKAAEKMQQFFLNFDMNRVNIKTGMPIYKPKDITSAVADAESAGLLGCWASACARCAQSACRPASASQPQTA